MVRLVYVGSYPTRSPQELAICGIKGRRRTRRRDLYSHRDLQAHGVEPQAYIADVITKIAGNWPTARWDALMPWNWRRDCQTIAEAA